MSEYDKYKKIFDKYNGVIRTSEFQAAGYHHKFLKELTDQGIVRKIKRGYTLKKGNWLAILPENHRLASQSVVNLKDISDEPYILLEEGHYSEPIQMFQACGLRPNIILYSR